MADEEEKVDRRKFNPGRPKLNEDRPKMNKLTLTFTDDQLRKIIIEAATTDGGPLDARKWCIREILKLLENK